jgi:hypothetical protein
LIVEDAGVSEGPSRLRTDGVAQLERPVQQVELSEGDRLVELDQGTGGDGIRVGLCNAVPQVAGGPRAGAGVTQAVDRVNRGRQEGAALEALDSK